MRVIQWLSNKIGVQSDKVLHFLVCFFVTFILSFVNPIFGASVALVLGLYKEFTDSHKLGNIWSWGDILADCLGILFGILLWFTTLRFIITLLL